ncbi:FlgO family outer membrane protein [Zoogloea sp.]|uniref:FlgO family outer membrane protein n=1 Tax=Zoogloea sp. TaxID=49181 RepID=UPI002B6DEEC8|nr:FlgO family outer membrane protein [Zoogloea sp.]
MRSLIYVTLASASLLLTACETTPKVSALSEPTYEQAQNNAFSVANYNAVSELMKRYPAAPAMASNAADGGTGAPFIIATLVNIDQLEQSSTLGRLISEQVASRMSQLGYGVLELKVRNGVYMKRNEGELLLTREIKEVASTHNAQAVIVGTYAESSTMVYVNLKVVNPASNIILAAYDYALPLDKQVHSLIRKR